MLGNILNTWFNVRQGALLNYMWSFFSETEDGEQVVFISETEDGEQVLFEIETEDR